MAVFDSYELNARLVPSLLVGLPIAVVLAFLVAPTWIGVAVALTLEAGLAVPLTHMVREKGRRLQKRLWLKWGGSPLAVRLSAGGQNPDEAIRRRAIAQLGEIYADLQLAQDGAPADFEPIAELLRHYVRQAGGNEVVFAENRQYGFERNLYAVRTPGILVALLTSGLAGFLGIYLGSRPVMLGAIAAVCVGIWWLFYPNEDRVRAAAEIYADSVIGLVASGQQASD